jgi:hypothetical protein
MTQDIEAAVAKARERVLVIAARFALQITRHPDKPATVWKDGEDLQAALDHYGKLMAAVARWEDRSGTECYLMMMGMRRRPCLRGGELCGQCSRYDAAEAELARLIEGAK